MTYKHTLKSSRAIESYPAWQISLFIDTIPQPEKAGRWSLSIIHVELISYGFSRMPMHSLRVTLLNQKVHLRWTRNRMGRRF